MLLYFALFFNLVVAGIFQSINLPEIDFEKLGGKIGVLGSFDSISLYDYVNASSILSTQNTQDLHSLYVRNISTDEVLKLAYFNGQISELIALNESTLAINGNFSKINNVSVNPPIFYKVLTNEISSFSEIAENGDKIPLRGSINTMMRDEDLLYLGGSFEFNNTYSTAIYNITSGRLKITPFKGFGRNSEINSILKISSDQDASGSILFGGKFETLGFSELLLHNITKDSRRGNDSNSSIIYAEQQISLKNGIFSSVNGADNDMKNIICPSTDSTWDLAPGVGGQWLVELPDEMKGIRPTKIRLYVPETENAVSQFRIYTYPNNGIMNLTYIDPNTHEVMFCDAWCSLAKHSTLKNATEDNIDFADEGLDDDSIFIDRNTGEFAMYYDDSTTTKTLGYGSNYQEFALINDISIDKIGLTVLGWYGQAGSLSGFELYSNQITIYSNETLNEPNCEWQYESDKDSAVTIDAGIWRSIKDLSSVPIADTDYLVSLVNTTSGGGASSISLYPNVTYSGNYSILIDTPGCLQDDSCNQRGIVNVTLYDENSDVLSTKLIFQNNDENKFDYLYYGHLTGSLDSDERNKIVVTFDEPIDSSIETSWMVMDKIVVNIVALDDYFTAGNHSNISKTNYDIKQMNLHGLFEYSLANFSNFDELKVAYTNPENNKTIININNTYVGSSFINDLSSSFSNSTQISRMITASEANSDYLFLLGDFDINKTVESSSIIYKIQSYNSTSNETELSSYIDSKRDEADTFGLQLNGSISNIANFDNSIIFSGNFSSFNNISTEVENLNQNNDTSNSINNFALYEAGEWYSFGNQYFNDNFDKIANLTLNDEEILVFSSSESNIYKVWNSSNSSWNDQSSNLLNITSSLKLGSDLECLTGSSFGIMDLSTTNQAFFSSQENVESYEFKVGNGTSLSYFINETTSIIAGKFSGSNYSVDFINSNATDLIPLDDSVLWNENSVIQSLYVNSNNVFIGGNGSVLLGSEERDQGLLIYNLKTSSFDKNQPAPLENDGSIVIVNSIALDDKNSRVIVGGNFTSGGSLSCNIICIYDMINMRWIRTLDSDSSVATDLSGYATNLNFVDDTTVLISGKFNIDNENLHFIKYDSKSQSFDLLRNSTLNDLASTLEIKEFLIVNEDLNDDLKIVAYGSDFISAYDGKHWRRIDKSLNLLNPVFFNDLKLIPLKSKIFKNDFLSTSSSLLLAGSFNITNHGQANLAYYNGHSWEPYAFTKEETHIGNIGSILLKDQFSLHSSGDIKTNRNYLSRGKVVGISLACALGSTAFIGLLYAIPFYFLTRSGNNHRTQRVQENEMMEVVNPEFLLHEIDLQKDN